MAYAEQGGRETRKERERGIDLYGREVGEWSKLYRKRRWVMVRRK